MSGRIIVSVSHYSRCTCSVVLIGAAYMAPHEAIGRGMTVGGKKIVSQLALMARRRTSP